MASDVGGCSPAGTDGVDVDTVRDQFPALSTKAFLDAACVSLAPRASVDAIDSFLDNALWCPERSSTLHHIAMDDRRALARPEVARLLNCDEDEIALVESTTHGLTVAAGALPLRAGSRVVLCDLEYLQVAMPWCQKRDELGLAIDVVAHRDGRVLVDDIAAAIGPDTAAVVVSSVQWTNGYRCDLASLGSLCRERGVWLIVDAIQHLGAMPLDVRATPVDLLACGGHKWLNAPFGAGFLYIRREAMERLRPPTAGYLSVETPEGGWGAYFATPSIVPVRDYSFDGTARRYEVGGTANYPGAIGLTASLHLVNQLGPVAVAARIYQLTDYLIDGLRTLGVTIVTPTDPKCRSGIVTFSVGSADENIGLMEHLLDQDVLVSVRYTSGVGGVRVSCHFYNAEQDVERLLDGTAGWLRRR